MPIIKSHLVRCSEAAIALGSELVAAFSGVNFIYGTQGKHGNKAGKVIQALWQAGLQREQRRRGGGNAAVGKAIMHMRAGQRIAKMSNKPLVFPEQLRNLNMFEPGQRADQYLRHGWQMMDMYYGQDGNEAGVLHQHRIRVIGEFVHRAMQFSGSYDQNVPGWKSYYATWGEAAPPGWWSDNAAGKAYAQDMDESAQKAWSATKEISRIIRWGIRKFGGTIYFEGAEVPYRQVFLANPDRHGDTEAEARSMFPAFEPGSSTHPWGAGQVISMWCGKITPLYKTHFLLSWCFNPAPLAAPTNSMPFALRNSVVQAPSSSELIALAIKDEIESSQGPLLQTLWDRFSDCDPLETVGSVADLVSLFHSTWYQDSITKLRLYLDQNPDIDARITQLR